MGAKIAGMVLAVLALSGCATLTVGERDLLPQPDQAITADLVGALAPTMALDTLRLARPDGAVLGGVHVHGPCRDITVVYFGGNQFLADRHGAQVARAILPLGVNLVLFDHRGSGHSRGEISLAALRGDALAIRDHVVEVLGVPPQRLVLHGFSLGGMLAGDVAEQRGASGLVLESTGSNASEWSRVMVPWYARPFLRVQLADSLHALDNHRVVSGHRGALLLMVGAEDSQTPAVMSRRLLASAADDAGFQRLYVAPGRGHEGVLGDPAAREHYAQLIDAVRQAAPAAGAQAVAGAR